MRRTGRPCPLWRGAARLAHAARWHDNDHYGHVDNIVHHAWFDTIVNALTPLC